MKKSAYANPLFKRFSSRPFSTADERASLALLRKWRMIDLEEFLEYARRSRYALQQRFPEAEADRFHVQNRAFRAWESKIRLIAQVLDEREAAHSGGVDNQQCCIEAPALPRQGRTRQNSSAYFDDVDSRQSELYTLVFVLPVSESSPIASSPAAGPPSPESPPARPQERTAESEADRAARRQGELSPILRTLGWSHYRWGEKAGVWWKTIKRYWSGKPIRIDTRRMLEDAIRVELNRRASNGAQPQS